MTNIWNKIEMNFIRLAPLSLTKMDLNQKEFGLSLRSFSIKSLLEYLVSNSNFESWVKLLGPPLVMPKSLREI